MQDFIITAFYPADSQHSFDYTIVGLKVTEEEVAKAVKRNLDIAYSPEGEALVVLWSDLQAQLLS